MSAQPIIIADPADPEQQLEVVAVLDATRDEPIHVFVCAIRPMGLSDLVSQFKKGREDMQDFLVYKDGRTDPTPSA